ncbi:molybdate ABC transporter permease subunit [Dietzia sp.]|uniref:molybdate ABC transporter permease subunit n=1 Tax=Dietzia sp. TaxID=1871616 RepID=UPI002FDAEE93
MQRRTGAGGLALRALGWIGVVLLVAPLAALVFRTPLGNLGELVGDGEVWDAIRLSLVCAVCATAVCAVVGTPIAALLAGPAFPGKRVVRALVTVPMLMPPVVGGVALLASLGRRGVAGQYLFEAFGLSLSFTTTAVVIAQAYVALPFFVMSVEGALLSRDRDVEEAVSTLGADPGTIFRRVTLPAVLPGIGAGAVLAAARALGEFGATITFAGNLQGVTRTMPSEIYIALQTDPDRANLLSIALIVVSLLVLVVLRGRWADRVGVS